MKKLLAICLILGFCVTLVACGNPVVETTGTAAVAETTAGTDVETSTETSAVETTSSTPITPEPLEIKLTEEVIKNQILGGWLGQMIGVAYGADLEFKYSGAIVPETALPLWSSEMVLSAYEQDDLYVEIPLLTATNELGIDCEIHSLAKVFAETTFPLWHANEKARENLKSGIGYPDAGGYLYNPHYADIDWQIESDYIGIMHPGLVKEAAECAYKVGHIMCYGDGVYGGVMMAALYAAAYTEPTLLGACYEAMSVIPEESDFYKMMGDVLDSYEKGDSWQNAWSRIESLHNIENTRCADLTGRQNISARLNAAYVLMALLYGGGDIQETLNIAVRCGQDTDCNASSAAGVLGTFLGASQIGEEWKSALNGSDKTFKNSGITLDDAVEMSYALAKETLSSVGGTSENGSWTFNPAEKSPVPYEVINDDFDLILKISTAVDGTLLLQYETYGKVPLDKIELDMGDGFTANAMVATYHYATPGTYTLRYTATATDGTSVSHTREITVSGQALIPGKPFCSVTTPNGGGNKDISVITDGIIPAVGSTVSSAQYDTYVKDAAVASVQAGITFEKAQSINTFNFTEGKHFQDGGWFNGEPSIEVLVNGVWKAVESTISKSYPANNLEAQGASFETYTFLFDEIKCNGVRIVGTPGGSAFFISIGELSVIGKQEMMVVPENVAVICNITEPTGSGAKNIEVVCDGLIPKTIAGQYDTYTGVSMDKDTYIGFLYANKKTIKTVAFTEGNHFKDGGWFMDGDLRIEVLLDGEWVNMTYTATPSYPTGDEQTVFGDGYETYVMTLLTESSCSGVRLIGCAGGDSGFISVSEIDIK